MRKLIFPTLLFIGCLLASGKVTLGFPGEKAASVGIYVRCIANDSVIAENDADRALVPASVMKALTAASALTSLDSSFRFHTDFYLTDNIVDGVCNGNLVVVSSTDPTIDSELFSDRPTLSKLVVDRLKKLGLTKLTGKVIIRENLIDAGCPVQWEIDDVAWSYGAGLFGFNYHDNTFTLWPATKRTSPHVPNLKVTLHKDSSHDQLRGIFSNDLHVYGPNIGNAAWSVKTTMNNPAEVFAYELKDVMTKNGIQVDNKETNSKGYVQVLDYQSPSLHDILHQMLVHSHNLYAEAMLRTLAPDASRQTAVSKEIALWKNRGVSAAYNHICDGSGLSRADRLRPVFLADMLTWMAKSKYAADYVSLFPKVGSEGTVKNFLKDTKLSGRLALKTGSMNAVQCYAGYKLDNDGHPTHVVIVLVNSFYCDRSVLRASIEKFLLGIF